MPGVWIHRRRRHQARLGPHEAGFLDVPAGAPVLLCRRQEELQVEEGSLYPALQKLLLKGWINGRWTLSESGRKVRLYHLTASGRKQLEIELAEFRRTTRAIELLIASA